MATRRVDIFNSPLNGTNDDDILLGDWLGNVLSGLDGDDSLFGEGGDDTLIGGAGNDDLFGGADRDRLFGGSGADELFGESGDDELFGGTGDDTLKGGANNDSLFGESGNDTLNGDSGNDFVDGGAGNDDVRGGSGDDLVFGGAGADVLYGGSGANQVAGGSGDDRVMAGGTFDGVDNYYGGDVFLVNGSVSQIGPDDSTADTIDYSAATARMKIDLDRGTAKYLASSNTYILDANLSGFEHAVGGAYSDTIIGSIGHNSLEGGAGDDFMRGLGGIDTLRGGADRDYLDGGAGNDSLLGQDGDDTLLGFHGDDRLTAGHNGFDMLDGGAGFDTADYASDTEGVVVDLAQFEASGADIGVDQLFGIERVVGGSGDDNLLGANAAETLEGRAGDDIIWGGGGADTLLGGHDSDHLFGEAGNDIINGGRGVDYLTGGSGGDTFVFEDVELSIGLGRVDGRAPPIEVDAIDTIADFDLLATGGSNVVRDRIDVSALLDSLSNFAGTTAQQAIDQGYIYFIDNSNSQDGQGLFTTVKIDLDGGNHSALNDIAVVNLQGIAEEQLNANHFIV